ncbi:hypothetical protein [Lactobacillus helveticus]|uniref:Uncharacterized protein n=1 Tax=Lactobacillus helveticus TaxID=1587 RepID=A0A9Q5BYX6_LACHE|nr:hypothetical protein [Lactobacillus helveticus]NRN79205.1 hypothetical protein [Lactobacillus helveticus]NRN83701.1 hypothetical protein [Lactobacillus helveticus]NRN92189.1 hypothetical protein [Lactobacillus helveticus]NRN96170.1 hypothetical protein [Lactobacillus helveticus]NRO15122.1 hypothetical protein [Lactobacillus helveticus]
MQGKLYERTFNKIAKKPSTVIFYCCLIVVLAFILLVIDNWCDLKLAPFIKNFVAVISSVVSMGMIIMSAIQIKLAIDDKRQKKQPKLKIFTFTADDAYTDPETGDFKIDREGKYNYTFCTNLGETKRSFQYYGICRKRDYPKIILPEKRGEYGDLFWINDKALKYIYPYLDHPEFQPRWKFETLDTGEVSKHYKINLTKAKERLKTLSKNQLEEFYVLYVDSTGYIFKELIRM